MSITVMNYIENTHIFIGDYESACDKELLDSHAITHIISLYRTPLFPNEFDYMVINIEDSPMANISKYFEETNKFLDDSKENGYYTLVHCAGGVSRSATIVIAYLLHCAKKNNITTTVDDIIKQIKKNRKSINPNSGFMEQLNDYHKSLF